MKKFIRSFMILSALCAANLSADAYYLFYDNGFCFNKLTSATAEVYPNWNDWYGWMDLTTGDVTVPSTAIDSEDGNEYYITRVGVSAFISCENMTSCALPETMREIGENAFAYCYSLSSVAIPSKVDLIEGYAFNWCISLTEIDLPESLTVLGDYAFQDCMSLESIEFPESIYSIGEHIFDGCESLKEIRIDNPDPSSIIVSDEAFSDDILLQCKLIVPSGSKKLYAESEIWGLFLEIEGDDSPILGDVDGDGSVSVSDITALIEIIIGSADFNSAADINGDSQVTVSDITDIVNLMLD